MTPFQVHRMPVGKVLHTPSCRVELKVVGVDRDLDSPALLIQRVRQPGESQRPSRRATVAQLSGYHLAEDCLVIA